MWNIEHYINQRPCTCMLLSTDKYIRSCLFIYGQLQMSMTSIPELILKDSQLFNMSFIEFWHFLFFFFSFVQLMCQQHIIPLERLILYLQRLNFLTNNPYLMLLNRVKITCNVSIFNNIYSRQLIDQTLQKTQIMLAALLIWQMLI